MYLVSYDFDTTIWGNKRTVVGGGLPGWARFHPRQYSKLRTVKLEDATVDSDPIRYVKGNIENYVAWRDIDRQTITN